MGHLIKRYEMFEAKHWAVYWIQSQNNHKYSEISLMCLILSHRENMCLSFVCICVCMYVCIVYILYMLMDALGRACGITCPLCVVVCVNSMWHVHVCMWLFWCVSAVLEATSLGNGMVQYIFSMATQLLKPLISKGSEPSFLSLHEGGGWRSPG